MKKEDEENDEEEERVGGGPPGAGGKSINKRWSPATQLAASSRPSPSSGPTSSSSSSASSLPFAVLSLSSCLHVLLLSLTALDIQTNKLGGPPGPGLRMNHLKQWNAD